MISLAGPAEGAATVVNNLKDWASQPFSEQQNLLQWFLWAGVLIIFVIAWIWIIHEIDKEI